MEEKFEIFIVAPNLYTSIGEKAAEELSKRSCFMCKTIEPKEFLAQEIPEQNNRFFISIGSGEENLFSKHAISTKIKSIKSSTDGSGLFVLSDKPYAVIFSAIDYSIADFAKDTFKGVGTHRTKAKDKLTFKEKVKAGVVGSATVAQGNIIAPGLGIVSFYKNKKLKEMRLQQTQIAAAKFFSDVFPLWISLNTAG